MKAIIIGMIYETTYKVTRRSRIVSWYDEEFSNEIEASEWLIGSEVKFAEEKILRETDRFHRVLNVNEIIDVNGKEYDILKVKHGDDGRIYYYVRVNINNDESYKKAERELELKREYERGFKEGAETKISDKVGSVILESSPTQKGIRSWFRKN